MAGIKIAHQNIRSLVPHINALQLLMASENVSVMTISETWMHRGINSDLVQIAGFDFLRRDYDGRGSGVGVYVSKNIKYSIVPTSFNIEHLCLKITMHQGEFIVCTIYRRHSQDYRIFLDELENLVTHCFLICQNVFLLGDFNIDIFKNDIVVNAYKTLIHNLGLRQLIIGPD